jgi:hypothetical protein
MRVNLRHTMPCRAVLSMCCSVLTRKGGEGLVDACPAREFINLRGKARRNAIAVASLHRGQHDSLTSVTAPSGVLAGPWKHQR